jgi:hypothetical protein
VQEERKKEVEEKKQQHQQQQELRNCEVQNFACERGSKPKLSAQPVSTPAVPFPALLQVPSL